MTIQIASSRIQTLQTPQIKPEAIPYVESPFEKEHEEALAQAIHPSIQLQNPFAVQSVSEQSHENIFDKKIMIRPSTLSRRSSIFEETIISDPSDTYIKTETDEKLDISADKIYIIEVCTKTETDGKLDPKAKIEDDKLLLLKADKIELDDYEDLACAQKINGTNQFNIISVCSISKQSKNDAFILSAGGGDMLVSSLVNQTELQEARDIRSGKSKTYMFFTQEELNDWITIKENVANSAIGQKFNIHSIGIAVLNYDNGNIVLARSKDRAISDLNASIDLSNYYYETEIESLLENKAETTDGMSTVTWLSFIKSGADNTVVLLRAGGGKPIAELGGSVNDTNYVKKTSYNLFVVKGYL
ncbi:MAG: hypothetical protein EZS28_018905 [Streblomastix strix]|uniref:Uncharacterized protein n=1 Tax=Streblomastix strix TaxID=222440 RepID=A0A5J4VSI5_9EUKA|nr:MAG: hypothetical protein EZS28_018905 [Streblomastix strix]